jgi:phosphohistidine swiveling domain-containing protein
MGFEPVWEDPSDEQRTWRRVGGPYPALYHDVERVLRQHYEMCWSACGAPMVREHDLRIMDGWFFASGPPFDEVAGARLAQHSASIEDFDRWYFEVLRPEVVEIVLRLRKHPTPSRPRAELVAHLEECMDAFGHIMGDLHWRMASARLGDPSEGKASFGWAPRYAEITGRPGAEAALFVGGLKNEMTKTVRELQKVARVAQRVGDGYEDHADFKRAFRSLLRKYGHRTGSGWGSNLKLGDPTWNVRPEIPLQMIATYARADLDALADKEREVAKERKRIERLVRRELKKDPERLAMFEKELAEARAIAFFFEDHNDWMDQSSPGLVRDAAHALGLHLVRKKKLDDPEDVLHLTLAELKDLPKDVRAIVGERKATFKRQSELDPPEILGVAVEGPPGPFMHDEGEGQKGNVLHGIAASSGRYTGRARVFLPGPIPPDVDDGDILVAVDAGPDWTPVFAILGAVVLDRGAAWQHAGVVAREFGIAAVTGTKVGTEVITDGSTITVDGDTGTVQLGT